MKMISLALLVTGVAACGSAKSERSQGSQTAAAAATSAPEYKIIAKCSWAALGDSETIEPGSAYAYLVAAPEAFAGNWADPTLQSETASPLVILAGLADGTDKLSSPLMPLGAGLTPHTAWIGGLVNGRPGQITWQLNDRSYYFDASGDVGTVFVSDGFHPDAHTSYPSCFFDI